MTTPRDYPPHEEVASLRGVASSAHPLATQAALEALDRGGSAVDAAIAAGAVLTVIMPTAGALGGDCFFLVGDPDGSVGAVNGSGAAPAKATLPYYQALGEIPDAGWQAATVPGMVDGWRTAHERWGKLAWDELFTAAIQIAAEGFVVTPEISRRFSSQSERLTAFPETSRIFFADGVAPQPGQILRQLDLANSFLTIAEEGPESFYQGRLAAAIAESAARDDGLITADDLASHTTPAPEPIQVNYRGRTVFGQPPVSQGIVLLMALGTLDEFDFDEHDWLHLEVEAIKQGFADRLQYLGDPDCVDVPIAKMLSTTESQRRAGLIDRSRSQAILQPAGSPDTTSLVTADREGRVVAYIHSLYAGCGVVVHGTGMMLNNRLRGFTLDPESPNCLAPGKRPVHTLNTALIDDGKSFTAVCTPGANLQVQHNLQVISYLIDAGLGLQEAIDAPRWSMGDQLSIGEEKLLIESRVGEETLASLRAKGHEVEPQPAWGVGGGIQVARVDRRSGTLSAGRDPRRATNHAAAL